MERTFYRRYNCPDWVKETAPAWVEPYRGSPGLIGPGSDKPAILGREVRGIDYWQTNHFIAYRPETAAYLYGEYTPLQVPYRRGTLPRFEAMVASVTERFESSRDRALAILRELIPATVPHPGAPPCGLQVPKDRGLYDEELLESGAGWCNEQARVFVRFCQVIGIPARLIFLFYRGGSGHAVSEFHVDGKWAFADTTWCCVAESPDGSLFSTAECHDNPDAAQCLMQNYIERYRDMLGWSDEALGETNHPGIRNMIKEHLNTGPRELGCFGVLNYPQPPVTEETED